MTLDDAPAVAAILGCSPEAAQWSEQACREMLQGHPDSLGLVGEEGRGVLGFLLCRHAVDELEILNLAVAPEARRTGAGSQLLEAALRQARAAGIHRVFLEVRESNRAAVAFYSRHGFCPAGRRPGYYTQPVEDALLLQLSLWPDFFFCYGPPGCARFL